MSAAGQAPPASGAAAATGWLEKLVAGRDLDQTSAGALLTALGGGNLDPAMAGALLTALRIKGESAAEIRGFALAMRALARRPRIPANIDAVDIVGTGGDGSGSLNLSTGSALLAAACGLKVVKHGNRSITSKSGSADALVALGLPVPLDEQAAVDCLEATGFTFLFAPHYHPAMQHIAPIRLALKIRTVFNILGPLVNPAEPPYHVIGAARDDIAALMAATLAEMPIRRAFVIHGAASWDEATPIGPFVCYDVVPGNVERSVRDPLDAGLGRCSEADLKGGEPAENAARLAAALRGEDSLAHRDALALGAGLALEVSGRATSLAAGVALAREALADGRGGKLLDAIEAFSAGAKA
jgi:anthranilate phosphoribosyltransferase